MRLALVLTTLLLTSAAASAAEPVGEWLVAEGTAHIRIENCGDRMWGVVSWEEEPGVDTRNPDAAKRGRSRLGMPIILGMKPGKEKSWEGKIYSSENGKTYAGSIKLVSDEKLRIEGCVLGFLCGGETWKRVPAEESRMQLPVSAEDFCTTVIGGDARTS